MTLRGRFKNWVREWLGINALLNGQLATDRFIEILGRDVHALHQRIGDHHKYVEYAFGIQGAARREALTALSRQVSEVEAALHTIAAWQLCEAVGFAVNKIERDKQFMRQVPSEQHIEEAVKWSRYYLSEHGWTAPDAERLEELVRTRMHMRHVVAN